MAVASTSRLAAERRVRPIGEAGVRYERRLRGMGFRAIAGLDEAGRGSWAGPLVAAAVVLPPAGRSVARQLLGLRDSKQLTADQRERYYGAIRSLAISSAVGLVPAETIDLLGLTAAGHLAMDRAVRALPGPPDHLLIDAFRLPTTSCPQEAIVFGDAVCLTIAAASVIAKVERDRLLERLGAEYPAFGFERNKGYGTAQHARALAELGPTPQHRLSYAPVRDALATRCPC